MSSSFRILVGVLMAAALVAAAGCKKGAAGTVPTKSLMTSFSPPDADEVFPEEDEEETDAGDAGEE